MNVPPNEFTRVSVSDLNHLVVSVLQKLDIPESDAKIIANLMVDTDLRGVFSHGTQCLTGYSNTYIKGDFNIKPEITVIKDTPVSVLLDGDGGLGHLPTYQATQMAIEKARTSGLCMAVTRHHGHFGSAGKYARLAVKEGFICFCVSGLIARMPEDPGMNAWAHYPLDNCPLAIGFPAKDGYPVIADICSSVMDEWDVESDRFKSIFSQMPASVFRSFGLRAATDFLSGALGGMMLPGYKDEERRWANAYYGAFLWVLDPETFVDPDAFTEEVDRTTDLIHSLQPLPGYTQSYLPGGPEWEREQEYRQEGIPLGERHRQSLEDIAQRLDVEVPW